LAQGLLGLQHCCTGKMNKPNSKLNLTLWLDKDSYKSQNRLLAGFWELFSQVGNSIDPQILSKIHLKNKGIKLSKGGDLIGYPYHVLDMIRDFDSDAGLNIRVLNWFGHGMYLFVHFGKFHPYENESYFRENGFFYCLSPSPWDYPDIILKDSKTANPTLEQMNSMKYNQWIKKIDLYSLNTNPKVEIDKELNNLLEFLLLKVG